MDNIKISVSFELPGSTMMTSQECDKNPKENYRKETVVISYSKREGKKIKHYKEYLNVFTRKSIPAKQVINMTKEAYDGMIHDIPEWSKIGIWKQMSKKQRIIAHLERIKDDLKATSYTFTILDE